MGKFAAGCRALAIGLIIMLSFAGSASAADVREGQVRVAGVEQSPWYPMVRQIALYHGETLVRASAWQAIWSEEGESALQQFVLSGFREARERAQQNSARNRDFVQRVLSTYTAAYSPRVHAAAKQASLGSDADRDRFVRTGFAEAKALDTAARESDEQHRQVIAQAERDYVRLLAESDPGEQVRLAAQHALRPGSTDADIREFYATGWMAAAALDVEIFRLRTQDAGIRYHAVIPRLVADAEAAEFEARNAGEAAAEQARLVAARAWATTREKAEEARQAWEVERLLCLQQALYWQTVKDRAAVETDPAWAAIASGAEKQRGGWTTETTFAGDEATRWDGTREQAQQGYDRMTTRP
ncbi:hypothetical protein [Amycolatopsis alba]|uniref:Uncharacterized protein n=1 Tax=Amycolatopsis alba DSM 44262 TaxID=1125972 RepID=A0A229RAF2_AMYAL|nr:hypothetical protein [Amycolatopsis alba]OXM43404.1 hypothetical protein CFP75_38555 [Amycolatopsis alba DSM 44262]